MSSGGLIYHLRALRFGKPDADALWAPHRNAVQNFLERWDPQEKTLILIGPSGGYSQSETFLKRFDRIIAIEPDPVARLIFEKRIHVKVEWVRDLVPFDDFKNWIKTMPENSAILFCNLLGQVEFKQLNKVRNGIMAGLTGRSWASYHDAMSGKNLQFDHEVLRLGIRASLAQMKSAVYPMVRNGTLTVNAHQAPDLFESVSGYPHFYWQWRILPKRTHLIEGIFHTEERTSGVQSH